MKSCHKNVSKLRKGFVDVSKFEKKIKNVKINVKNSHGI